MSSSPPLLPPLVQPSRAARAALLFLVACASGETATEAPPPVPVARLVLRAAVDTVYLGDVHTLAAQPVDGGGSPLGGRAVTWTSQAPALVPVSGDGVVTGMLLGRATLVARCETATATLDVVVAPQPVARIVFEDTTATRPIGASVATFVHLFDRNGVPLDGRVVSYASSAPTIATVDAASGVVTAVAPGTASVTATSEGRTATMHVTVLPPAPVSRVLFWNDALTLVEGASEANPATTLDASGVVLTDRPIRYESSAPTIATVDGTGRVTGVAPGTAVVSATSEGRSATATVEVQARPVARVAFATSDLGLEEGATAVVAAIAYDASGRTLPDRVVSYTSDAPLVATVDATGRLTARAAGIAMVTATSGNAAATLVVTVRRAVGATLVLSATRSLPLAIGDTMTIAVAAYSAAGVRVYGRPARFVTSAPTVATVDGTTGLVTALGAGTATLTAIVDGVSQSLAIGVSAVLPTQIFLTPPSPMLFVGTTLRLTVSADPFAARPLAGAAFVSSRPWIAAVDEVTGVVRGVAVGSTLITARWGTLYTNTPITIMAAPDAVTPSSLRVGAPDERNR